MTMSKSMLATEREEKSVVVIKCGGSIINELTDDFFQSLSVLKQNHHVVIVHGGGPDIAETLNGLNIQTEFVEGLRKTSDEVLNVVQMVLGGKVNKTFVTKLFKNKIKAVGLSGCDGAILQAQQIQDGKLGFVGEVSHVESNLLYSLLEQGYVPVISSIGMDENGQLLNVNADVAAGAVAKGLKAERLLFITDVKGVLKDGELLETLTVKEVEKLIDEQVITGGMIPKVKTAVSALSSSLDNVYIASGTSSFCNEQGLIGTSIKYDTKSKECNDERVVSNI
ncbi:acetylglutamate kinase [Priestia endophytica]|uniref:Acetylglutamate kinase n=1 Tax=Priestia endophytica TaxID=135735 RepID=A0AAX1Q342_9BACI|nr:acetylglutamate kinase [Priestia endophytica]MCM3536500.1 acetylglutamate kinase [Priestia endophytica]RAS72401.1 acetylglutamate kinase [Priestia endophytica]RAS90039.1 acetylglutamate kinase [Priestia endophytica]